MRFIWALLLLFSTSFQDEVPRSNSTTSKVDQPDPLVTEKSFESLKISRNDLRPSNKTPPVMKLSAGMEFAEEFADEESIQLGNDLYISGLKHLHKASMLDDKFRDYAYKLFATAVELNHKDAIKHIAYAHLFGDRTAWSPSKAYEIFEELARQGSPDAQFALGFMHATGIGMKKSNPAKALDYYTFAANGGSPLAQMAMGYRYSKGIGIAQDCSKAAYYYSKAGRRVASNMNGFYPFLEVRRLSDENGHIYPYIGKDILENLHTMTNTNVGDKMAWEYQEEVGDMYLTGLDGVPRDSAKALRLYKSAAKLNKPEALARLGQMYLIGTPAIPVNYTTAFDFFSRSAENAKNVKHSGRAYLGLSMMYFYGYGVEVDYQKTLGLLDLVISKQGDKRVKGEAYLLMAELLAKAGPSENRTQLQIKNYELAIQHSNYVAAFNMGILHHNGIGVPKNCSAAVDLYKVVAEEGLWTERLAEAHIAYYFRRTNEAAIKYALMAEIGYEKAQTNFAYMLENGYARDVIDESREKQMALTYWLRAARQNCPFARNMVGDYYFHGWGVKTNYVKALIHYFVAAEEHKMTEAMLKLSYMHLKGLGVPKDLPMAKHYYDLAADSANARFSVLLARVKLSVLFMIESLNEWPLVKFLEQATNGTWDLVLMALLLGAIIGVVIMLFRRNQHTQ